MGIDKSKYVVLDVESNGLNIDDDILSISLYKPDDETFFHKYLPLENSKKLKKSATDVNGITYEILKGATPLTQEDIDVIIETFELERRIILTYSTFDKNMLRRYFARKKLIGFQKLNFYNFKEDIISSKYSEGNVTKDNLCRLFDIGNVTDVHNSLNDCILEWQLFEKMNGNKLFITENKVFEMNKDYIVPVSYFETHPKLQNYVTNLPNISMDTRLIKRFELSGQKVKRFKTNFNGMIIEHLLNTMLEVEEQDSRRFLLENKGKLRYLGRLPSESYDVPLYFKADGTVEALNEEDLETEKELNEVIHFLKPQMEKVICFIKNEIFKNERILSQELVVNKNDNILAMCDLSSKEAILEIKTNYKTDPLKFKLQLYYESNGRQCYLLQVDWTNLPEIFVIEILQVEFTLLDDIEVKRTRMLSLDEVQKRITNDNIKVVQYLGQNADVALKCNTCNYEWQVPYNSIINNPRCPNCESKKREKKKVEKQCVVEKRKEIYYDKLAKKSNGNITVTEYVGAKEKVNATCKLCGYNWDVRADHLLTRTYCPRCKKNKL